VFNAGSSTAMQRRANEFKHVAARQNFAAPEIFLIIKLLLLYKVLIVPPLALNRYSRYLQATGWHPDTRRLKRITIDTCIYDINFMISTLRNSILYY